MSKATNTPSTRQLRSRKADLVSNLSPTSISRTAISSPLRSTNPHPTIEESFKRQFSSLSPPLTSVLLPDFPTKKTTLRSRLPKPTSSPTRSSPTIDTNFISTDGTSCIPPFTSVPQRSQQFELSSSAPEWALNFQSQFRDLHQRLSQYDSRLATVEDLVVENARLRAELDVVKTALTEAQNVQLSTSLASTAQPPHPNHASPPKPQDPPSATTNATTNPAPTKQRRKTPASARTPTPAAIAALQRKFLPSANIHSGYRFIYYKANKQPLSWYREKVFPKLGIHDSRVLDIHFPIHTVVSFLMHYDFVLEFTTLMKNHLHIDPLLDFDPLEDRNLLDPAFSSLDSVSRSQKINDLHNKRVLRAISFVRLSLRVTVAKSMLLQSFIVPAQFDAILADTLAARAEQYPVSPPPTASSAERKAKKRLRLDYYFNLKYLDPLSALTIASSSPHVLSPTPTGPHANDVSMQS